MKGLLATVLAFALVAGPAVCGDLSSRPTEALIDDLTALDANTPGIDDAGMYDAFLAEDAEPHFEAGLLPLHPPSVHPAARELVRRGAAALPALIAHLGDRRPTQLSAGRDMQPLETVGGQFFADEYDPRDPGARGDDCTLNDTCRGFDHPYRVKVGDVCEVLIGQIVNRPLYAVRYQPTAIVYVNSPIEQPSLVGRIAKDWGGLDSAGLEAALLEDLRIHPKRFVDGALRRLRFYYPKTYAGLGGADLEKRQAFEAREAKEKAAR